MQTPTRKRLVHSFEFQDNLKKMSPLPKLKGCTWESAISEHGLGTAPPGFYFLFEHLAQETPHRQRRDSEEDRKCAR
jgi:hypothetical protein